MRTSKPVSTISYNSQEFLVGQLEQLLKSRTISDYMFINHFAESDEKKNHIHLWIKPNKLIDTMALQAHFLELDAKHPTKPLKCIDFRVSKTDDWILYNQHYAPYLASKGETREYHYTKDDFVAADEDTFEINYQHAFKGSEWALRYQILEQLARGDVKPAQLILNGTVPLNLASQVNAFMFLKEKYGMEMKGQQDDSTGNDSRSQDAQT